MMLKSISWGVYLEILLIALPTYYLIILTLFYRRDLHRWLAGRTGRLTGQGPVVNRRDTPNNSSHASPIVAITKKQNMPTLDTEEEIMRQSEVATSQQSQPEL